MIIQEIRNATLKITYGGATFLVDPWLQDKGTGPSAPAIRPEMQGVKNPLNDLPFPVESILADVDFCLVSHVHPDHVTKDYLPDETRMIAQNESDVDALRQMGFRNVELFSEFANTFKNATVTRVDGVHGDSPKVAELMGRVSGFVFAADSEKTLYIAGDTVYYDGVRETIQRFQPDVVILNCCGATMPIGRLIMGLEDVRQVCADAPNATIIAVHLDSVNHATVTSDDVRRMAAENRLSQLLTPKNGEIIRL